MALDPEKAPPEVPGEREKLLEPLAPKSPLEEAPGVSSEAEKNGDALKEPLSLGVAPFPPHGGPPSRPKDYLCLAIFACFCPIWPINAVALVFSIMSRNSGQQGDLDGARRLGRVARFLSLLSILLGSVIILTCSLNFAGLLKAN
nr:trafficking regulator of GLUT4 1 [Anolis sagrei ordinatus]